MTNPSRPNPLLQKSTLPHEAPVYSGVTTADLLPAVKAAIDAARAEITAIKTNPDAPTFENTIEALETAGALRNRVGMVTSPLLSCMLDEERMELKKTLNNMSQDFSSEVSMDADLFKRIKKVYDNRASLTLNPEQKLLLENTYKEYVRSGAELDDAGKETLRKINSELSKLGSTFGNNLVAAYKKYSKVVDEADLAGVPDDAKARYAAAAKAEGMDGKFLIRLQPPPFEIYEYCTNRALREELSRASTMLTYGGEFDNTKVLLDIVRLREEAAKLLSYDNHAHFVLEDRMAKDVKTVMEFLDRNEAAYKPAAEAYVQKIRDYAEKVDGLKDLKPWDMAYYGRRLKEETFSIDLNALRDYFSLDNVFKGLTDHAEKLFGIKMTDKTSTYDVYHPDVKVYEVTDSKTGKMIGLFYADYYARPGAKNGGAWMNGMRNADAQGLPTIVSNNCNYAKPLEGKPCLLTLDQVTTLYHEFGHGLHGLLGQGQYASQTGTNVKWDFVELPSQLMENWVTEKEVLDGFAKHWQTGAPIPADLVQKIDDMSKFDAGYGGLRQTFLGKLDMKWHTTPVKDIESLEKLEDELVAQTWLFPRHAGPQSTGFSHIFAGGYAAGYYSYKWAAVLDADVFEVFKKKGLYDAESGKKLRDTIYTMGGTKDPNIVFKDMMGRDKDASAMYRREGITPPSTPPVVPPPAPPAI